LLCEKFARLHNHRLLASTDCPQTPVDRNS
jgi:hypothetical protein